MNCEDPIPFIVATHKVSDDGDTIPCTPSKRRSTLRRASMISEKVITKETKRILVRRASMTSINNVATSIGNSYHRSQSMSLPSQDGVSDDLCPPDASQLEDELKALRDSTESMIQKSWDDVEKLQTEVSEQENMIRAVKAELEATRALLATSKKKEKDADAYYDKMKTKLVKYKDHHRSSSSMAIELSNSALTKKYRHKVLSAPSLFSIGDTPNCTPASKQNATWPRPSSSLKKNFLVSTVKSIVRVEPSEDEKDLTIHALQMKLLSRDNVINSMEDMISNHIELLQKHPHVWK